jgi:hypothetical protein
MGGDCYCLLSMSVSVIERQRYTQAFFAPIPEASLGGRHLINSIDKCVRFRIPFPDNSAVPECDDSQWGCGFPSPAKRFQQFLTLGFEVNVRRNPMGFCFTNHKYPKI